MARATSTTNNADAGVPSAPDATGALPSFDSKNYRGRGSNPHGPRVRGILSPLRLPIPPPRLGLGCCQGRSIHGDDLGRKGNKLTRVRDIHD